MDRSFAYLVAIANLDNLIATYFFIYLDAYLHQNIWQRRGSNHSQRLRLSHIIFNTRSLRMLQQESNFKISLFYKNDPLSCLASMY